MRVEELSGRILVDTNVLIYATLKADRRHEQAQRVLSQRHRPGVEMFVSVQNLAEMYPNLTGSKNQPADSPTIARDKILSISRLRSLTILPLTPEGVHRALDLCVEGGVTKQSYFDHQPAALTLREKIPIILTENVKDFIAIDGITAINPFA
jgi:predicted nucleic acid-binding protein